MARPSAASADPVATTERILAAAESEFARHGFAAARLADVAGRAGIRRPSLLYHFPSKQALYEAVVGRVFTRLGTVLAAAMGSAGEFQSRFEAVIRAFAGFLESTPHFASLILRELLDDQGSGRDSLRTGLVPVIDAVEEFLIREGGAHLPPDLPVRALLLQIACATLLHAAAGSLRRPLWREPYDPVTQLRASLPAATTETTP